MEPIWILHLSDFHIKETTDDSSLNLRIRELVKNWNKETPVCSPDICCITGDIAFSGKEQEYQKFSECLGNLFRDFNNPDLKNSTFIVPGNHDQVRLPDEFEGLPLKFLTDPQTGDTLNCDGKDVALPKNHPCFKKHASEIGDLWKNKDNSWHEMVAPRFKNFDNWMTTFFGDTHYKPLEGLVAGAWVKQIQCKRSSVQIIGLNSAISSTGFGDDRKVWLSGKQVEMVLGETGESDITFALMHYPLNCLVDEWVDPAGALIRKHCHFVINGHDHRFGIQEKDRDLFQEYSFTARAFGDPQDRDSHGYNIIKVTDSEIRVFPKVWSRRLKFINDYDWISEENYDKKTFPLQSVEQYNLSRSEKVWQNAKKGL